MSKIEKHRLKVIDRFFKDQSGIEKCINLIVNSKRYHKYYTLILK